MIDQIITTIVGLGLLAGGYGLWLLTGIVNAAVNTKTWSWKKTGLDISKALLMGAVIIGLVALSNGIDWYAGLLGFDVSQFTDGMSTITMLGGITAGIAIYYGRAAKNALNFFKLRDDVVAEGEQNYAEIAKQAKEATKKLADLITPKHISDEQAASEESQFDAKEDEVGQGADVNPLSRRLGDGDNCNGKFWQCSKYSWYLGSGIVMNYAPHPDYGPCNGVDMVDYLISKLGWVECGKINGAIFSYASGKYGHCLPIDNTEVLTENGFVPLGEIKEGDLVYQANPKTIKLELTPVLDVVVPTLADVYRRRDIELTDGHNVVYRSTGSKSWSHKKWIELLDKQITIPTSGQSKNKGIDLTDNEIKLLVAIQADGSYIKSKHGKRAYDGIEFHITKERKTERLKFILDKLGIKYKENTGNHICIYSQELINKMELWLDHKVFTHRLAEMSKKQAEIFLKEVKLWDGCTAGAHNYYCSCNQQNLDVVQHIAAINGHRARLSDHKVCFTDSAYTLTHKSEYSERETLVSCIRVESGYFVARQNGLTMITGNTGMVVDAANNIVNDANWTPLKVSTHYLNLDAVGARYACPKSMLKETTPVKKEEPVVAAPKKSDQEIADEVIAGKWGNGDDRKNRLKTAGYNYDTIQSIVNAKLSPKTEPKVTKQSETFRVGDTVVPIKLVDYTGHALRQFDSSYTITSLSGNRAVLSARGQIWAALNTRDIRRV